MGDDTFSVEGRSMGRMRRADPVMLRTAFRRCHNYIHGNEGMPKDACQSASNSFQVSASKFFQLLRLI